MLKYILKRFIYCILTLWVVITITFALMHAIPGGPFSREKPLQPEIKKQIEARYNLNKPLWWQYTDYLKNLLKMDLGPSFQYKGVTVNQIIKRGFKTSAQLGILASIVAIVAGVVMGVAAALNEGKWLDHFLMFLSTLGITIPSFVLAALLIYIFSTKLDLLPPIRWGSPAQAIMPTLALAATPTAFISRLTRSSLMDVVRQDYIRTARAKGLSEGVVIFKHALKNSLIPIITYLGPEVSGILTGSFVIESIFAIPGIGREFVNSITNRDYTTILGLTILSAALLILFNFIVDIIYVFVDPRIKLED